VELFLLADGRFGGFDVGAVVVFGGLDVGVVGIAVGLSADARVALPDACVALLARGALPQGSGVLLAVGYSAVF
jgi:hypothetical protein